MQRCSLLPSLYQNRMHARNAKTRNQRIAQLLGCAEADEIDQPLEFCSPFRKLAGKLSDCGSLPLIMQDVATGRIIHHKGRCNQRLCPLCSQMRSAELESVVREHVGNMDAQRLMTLTLAASEKPLKQQIEHLLDSFRRLRRRNEWKSHVTGGIAVVEITYHAKKDRWHPHLHIICDGEYWRQADLADEWMAVTGDSKICDIRAIHSKAAAAAYIAKYVAKSAMIADLPDARFRDYVEGTKGLRVAQTFGTLHGKRTKRPPIKRPEGMSFVCPADQLYRAKHCGEQRAARLWRAVGLILADRVPDGGAALLGRDEARHNILARKLRNWWTCTKDAYRDNTTRIVPPAPVSYRARDRAIRLRQVAITPPFDESDGPWFPPLAPGSKG